MAEQEDFTAVLETVLRLVMTAHPTPPLEEIFHPAARATYFLLDVDRDGGVEFFMTYTLHRLLHMLGRTTERRQIQYRGQVRGQIMWPTTLKARYGEDYDPTRYVCREVRRQYDTPENQLLKYVLARISSCLDKVPGNLRPGRCLLTMGEQQFAPDTATRLGNIEMALIKAQRNIYLRDVTLLQQITPRHLAAAQNSRIEEYAEVANIYEHYRRIVGSPSQADIVAVGKRVLPLPVHTHGTEDAWLQLCADILRSSA